MRPAILCSGKAAARQREYSYKLAQMCTVIDTCLLGCSSQMPRLSRSQLPPFSRGDVNGMIVTSCYYSCDRGAGRPLMAMAIGRAAHAALGNFQFARSPGPAAWVALLGRYIAVRMPFRTSQFAVRIACILLVLGCSAIYWHSQYFGLLSIGIYRIYRVNFTKTTKKMPPKRATAVGGWPPRLCI